jgi:hypothetical protein
LHIREIISHPQNNYTPAKKIMTAKKIVKAAKEAAKAFFYCNITLHDKTPKTRSMSRLSTHPLWSRP